MISRLLIATTNRGKLEELQALLSGLDLDLITPDQLHLELDVEETGKTYEENAVLKARAFSRESGLPAMADDTGLEVDALGGQPGIYSARYIGGHKTSDGERRKKLVRELRAFPQPWTARFCCSVALAFPDGRVITTFGEVNGEIHAEERGENGFGYDPLFFIPLLGKTMAECTMEEKNQISHRALAVKAAIPYLRSLLNPS